MCFHVCRQEWQLDIVAFRGGIVTRRVVQQEKHSPPCASWHRNAEDTERTLACIATQSRFRITQTSFTWCWFCEMLVVTSTCLWQQYPSSWCRSCCSTFRLWYDPILASFRCSWPLPVSCLEVGNRRELFVKMEYILWWILDNKLL